MSLNSVCQIGAAAALAFVVSGAAGTNAAQAASADATASTPVAASAPLPAGSQITVYPGQSLSDVAVAATQSHDRATLARASKALFDANPNAFMSHDPSRLRLGAVLTVPALDATGAALGASVAAGASASSGAASSATSATTAGTAGGAAIAHGAASQLSSEQANAASAAAHAAPAAAGPASAPLLGGAATAGAVASAASAGSMTATTAAGGVAGSASSPVGAASAVASASASASALAASGAHVWTGAIQPSASAPVAGASAAPLAQAPTQVSSLQQLLALKSRVLMELQKHGIGGKPAQPSQAGGAAMAGGQSGAAAGSGLPGNNATANSHATSSGLDLSPVNLGFAAAVGAAAVALLAALGLRRRKTRVKPADVVATPQAEEMAGPETVMARDNAAPHEDVETHALPVSDEYAAREEMAAGAATSEAAARQAAEREAAEHEAATREAAEREAAAREAAAHEAAAHEAAAHEAAAHEAAAHEAAAHEAAAHEAAAHEAAAHEAAAHEAAAHEAAAHEASAQEASAQEASAQEAAAHEAAAQEAAVQDAAAREAALRGLSELPSSPATEPRRTDSQLASAPHPFDDATAAASYAESAESGADALPSPTQFAPAAERPADQASAHSHQWNQAPETHPSGEVAEPRESYTPPLPQINFGSAASHGELHTEAPFGQVPAGPSFDQTLDQQPVSTPPQPEAQWEQPTLPDVFEPAPRIDRLAQESAAPHVAGTESQSGQPFATIGSEPSATTGFPRDAVDAFGSLDMGLPPRVEPPTPVTPPASLSTQPVVEPDITARQAVPPHAAAPRHAAEEIAAGTAGSAAVAGLGAARFGALNLDFDLELPPSPAQPLPTFTPQDLARIARNKLDLASEYIELGDLAGARALIHEVIEANDDATRAQARALLSTLAPHS